MSGRRRTARTARIVKFATSGRHVANVLTSPITKSSVMTIRNRRVGVRREVTLGNVAASGGPTTGRSRRGRASVGGSQRGWWRSASLADLARGPHRVERARDDLRRARAARVVGRLGLEQLGVREDDARAGCSGGGRAARRSGDRPSATRVGSRRVQPARSRHATSCCSSRRDWHGCDERGCGCAPQRVDEDADRAAGRADVFDLAADIQL